MSALPRLRAPAENGAVLAVPALDRVGTVLRENRRRLNAGIRILDRPLADLQQLTRQTTVAQAQDYMTEAGEPLPTLSGDRLIVAGHQPELIHPGVWMKNFALNGLARTHGLIPLQFIVDQDTAKSAVLRMPVLGETSECSPHIVAAPFDQWHEETPFEERRVIDEGLFASLPDRAAEYMTGWTWTPLLSDFWNELRQQARRTPLLGERVAAGRRAFERRWGCHNLEVPLSRVCATESFAWFACHLLVHLREFHPLYNDIVRDYRRRHGIRSAHHPVPDLARGDDWLEMPFWAWRSGQGRRRRLMARPSAAGWELRAGGEPWPTLSGNPAQPQTLIAAWQTLEGRGFKVRFRALTTTLFARLLLGDLFIHGIGGAKYDELTDELLRRSFGILPPEFLTLTGTLLLPFPVSDATDEGCRRLARERRDLWWNPQLHVEPNDATGQIEGLVLEKQRWIAESAITPAKRQARFEHLRRITERLREFVADRHQETTQRWERCEHCLDARAVLSRRDYAFCLYPEAPLRAFCRQFLALN